LHNDVIRDPFEHHSTNPYAVVSADFPFINECCLKIFFWYKAFDQYKIIGDVQSPYL
jgi:hypothetical protein